MRTLALTLLLALALATAAAAAPGGKYKGKVVDDSGKVGFKVVGKKVKKFEIDGVYANCGFAGGMLMSVYVPSAKIKGNRFKARYVPDPDSDFHVILKGRFDGSKARGTIEGEGICGYEEKWTAKH